MGHDAVVRKRSSCDGAWVDVDAVTAAVADSAATTAPVDTVASTPAEVPWLRPGTLEGLPSFALESVSVRDVAMQRAETSIVFHAVDLRLDARAERAQRGRLDLDVSSPDVGRLRGGANLATTDSLRVRFDRFDWIPPGETVAPFVAQPGLEVVVPSDVVRRAQSGALDVVPLRARGVLLDERPAQVGLDVVWDADGALRADADVRIEAAPTWVGPFLASADSAVVATVEGLVARWPEAGYSVRAQARGRVVGTHAVLESLDVDGRLPGPAALLPESAPGDALFTVLGVQARPWGERGIRGDARVEVPNWLEVDVAGARWDGARTARADSIVVRGPGLRIDGGGAWTDATLDARLRAAIATDALLPRLAPWLDLEEIASTPGRVDLTVVARGAVDAPDAELALTVARADAGPALRVDVRHAAGGVVLDVEADVSNLLPLLPDSLRAPWEESTVQSLRLRADGRYDLADSSATADVALDVAATEGSLHFDARVAGGAAGFARAQIDTLRARWRDLSVRNRETIAIDADVRRAHLTVDGFDLQGSLGRYRVQAQVDSTRAVGRIDVDAAVPRERLLAWWPDLAAQVPPADTLAARVRVDLEGTPDRPTARVDATLRAVRPEDVLGLTLRAALGDELTADLSLAVDDSTWIEADAFLPVTVGLDPPTAVLRDDEELRLRVRTPRLELDELARRASAPVDLDGDLAIEFLAEGPFAALRLGGAIRSTRARIEHPDGSWIETSTDVALAGDLRQPRVDGAVVVRRGLIVLPEIPPSRLPTRGESLLWTEIAARDTTAAPAPTAASPLDTFTVPLPDVTMTLDVPAGLRVRGHGLDIELQGRVEAIVAEGVPGLGGGLDVGRGRLDLLGRRFEVETGTVLFDPDQVEPDPELEIRLATRLEGTRYTVDVTGTATAPRLALGSEPSMPEGDIVSALLFGRPLDELDDGQSSLLAQRTQEIAAAYGASVLSQRIGRQLGVDILSIEPASDGGAAALVVGQYLSPDVVIQYEQVLEEGAAAVVRLEYAITRFLRLETTASQGDHSGVELEWRRDH